MPDESIETQVARIDERTRRMAEDMCELKEMLDETYVTQDQFEPIRRVVYGLVGLALTSVVVAVLAVVLK